jgi:hypothetical protein
MLVQTHAAGDAVHYDSNAFFHLPPAFFLYVMRVDASHLHL